jgi:hypothetical protein
LIIASVKAAAASTFFNVMSISISNSEGAGAPLSMLIVRCNYSEISFHFCEDCRIFHEGVKGNGMVEQKLENENREGTMSTTAATAKLNDLFGHNALVVRNNLGPIGLIVKINDLQRTEMSHSTNKFQLVVDSIVILNCEGARAVPITVSEGAKAVPAIFCDRSSKFIVASNSEGEISKAELDFFGINDQISLVGLICLAGQIKRLVEQNNGLVGINDHYGHIDPIRLVSLVGQNSLIHNGLVGCNHLADFIGLVGHHDLIDFIDHNGLVHYIGLGVSFIGGFVGFVGLGLGLASLGGLIGNIRLVSLVGFVGLVLVGFISLGLVNQLIGLISLISLSLVDIISLIGSLASFAHRLISLIGLIGLIGLGDLYITSLVGLSVLSARQLIGLISFVIAAKTI